MPVHRLPSPVPPRPANTTAAEELAYVNGAIAGYVYEHASAHQVHAARAVLRAALNTLAALKGREATAAFCEAYAREMTPAPPPSAY